jgi:hypothetical protein
VLHALSHRGLQAAQVAVRDVQAQHKRVLVHIHIGQLALRIDLEPLPASSSTWRRTFHP